MTHYYEHKVLQVIKLSELSNYSSNLIDVDID